MGGDVVGLVHHQAEGSNIAAVVYTDCLDECAWWHP